MESEFSKSVRKAQATITSLQKALQALMQELWPEVAIVDLTIGKSTIHVSVRKRHHAKMNHDRRVNVIPSVREVTSKLAGIPSAHVTVDFPRGH